MRARRTSIFLALVIAALGLAGARESAAQPWPSRAGYDCHAVRGGSHGRPRRTQLRRIPGQGIRTARSWSTIAAGAGGNVGGASVARAAPDGYTLLLATTGPAANNKLMYKNMPYDPQRDLVPIALMGKSPVIVTARADFPATNLKELVAYGKANPGAIKAGYPGNGTLGHITGELLQNRTETKFVQVQYRGSPAIINDMLGGHIDIGMDSTAPYVSMVQEKKLRGLAIAGAKRWPQLPDVPTIAELGFPGFEASVWYALMAPRQTPSDIIAKLSAAANGYLKTKAATDLFQNSGHRGRRRHARRAEGVYRRGASEVGADHQGREYRVLITALSETLRIASHSAGIRILMAH